MFYIIVSLSGFGYLEVGSYRIFASVVKVSCACSLAID